MSGARPYYERVSALGTLFHTRAGHPLGIRLDRHDEVVFGMHPFRKRHRGASSTLRPKPALTADGGVALKSGHNTGGSTAYIALQVAAGMGFERIWLAGLDGGVEPKKFTGEKSNCKSHEAMWRNVPPGVKERLRVIRPSLTGEAAMLPLVEWPWGPLCS